MSVKQSQDLDFNSAIRIINLPNAVSNGQPVTFAQIANFLSTVSVAVPLTGNGTVGSPLTIDFAALTTAQKNALRTSLNVEDGAQINVQSDWNAVSGDALILNKPTIPTLNNTLTSTSTTEALTAAQGKILNDRIDGLGDNIVVADNTARDALTGLDAGDIIHVIDAGAGKWEKWQITNAGDGTYANATKVPYASQESYEGSVGATNLGQTRDGTTVTVTSSTGASANLPAATTSLAGVMTAADKTQLNLVVNASATVRGLVELATTAETTAGTDTIRAVTPSGLANSVFARKTYSANLGNGSASTFTVNHALNTVIPSVSLKENSSGAYWACQPIITDANNISIVLDFVPTSNQFTIIVRN